MTLREPLSKKQQQLLDVIRTLTAELGHPPSFVEIAKAMGFKSSNAACDMAKILVRKGYLKQSPGRSRTLVIIDDKEAAPTSEDDGDVSLLKWAVKRHNPVAVTEFGAASSMKNERLQAVFSDNKALQFLYEKADFVENQLKSIFGQGEDDLSDRAESLMRFLSKDLCGAQEPFPNDLYPLNEASVAESFLYACMGLYEGRTTNYIQFQAWLESHRSN